MISFDAKISSYICLCALCLPGAKNIGQFSGQKEAFKIYFFTHKYTQRKRLFLFFVYTFLSVLWCDFIIKQVHLSTIKCTLLFHLVFNDSFRGG